MEYCIEIDKPKKPDKNVMNPAVIEGGKYDGLEATIVLEKESKKKNIDPDEQIDLDLFIDKLALMPIEQRFEIISLLKKGKASERYQKVFDKCKSFKLDSGEFFIKPTLETERIYIAGKSGSGKSYLSAMYIREYKEMFPDRNVILLSTHSKEKAYQPFNVLQIDLGEEFIKNPPTLNELRDSLVIFDDCDNLQNKKLQSAVNGVNNDLISNGRKYNIHVVSLAHQLMDYARTRHLLNEANRVIFFLTGGGAYHVRRYLKVYAGLEPSAIKKIMSLRSRWVCLGLNIPTYYLSQNEIGIL